ncbi:TetR/AcrR family transcriptional regulator [Dactylosporangium sp. NBC_01737]|uniref:TetR/AcrR family transcriptional regulator n=1 Tax=Dactylosporangium sp. NBC_01737 TaxID=2975959 RepID=UPI002E15D4AD|nr:TetR/AcrR family transcriptional regulator [Dactylosporangium sp. NBC_01737]
MAEPVAQRSRKRRLDAKRSRAAVLDAAIAVLGRQVDASIEDIAAVAGVVRQTVYAHFPSRTALIGAVVEHLTAESARALDALDLTTPPPDEALRRWLEASWAVVLRYPVLLSPLIADAVPPADEHDRHRPVTAQLDALVRRGRQAGVFDARHGESWIITVTIALGHAAGQEVTAGRMGPDEAGAAYRDSVLRLVLNRPITEAD